MAIGQCGQTGVLVRYHVGRGQSLVNDTATTLQCLGLEEIALGMTLVWNYAQRVHAPVIRAFFKDNA